MSGLLYNAIDSSTRNVLVLFQLMEPLHWSVTQVSYGNASGFLITLSSFLSSVVLSRWLSDCSLITIGLLSNAASMLPMAFATTTYMFFIARVLALFSLMPVPLIYSLLSQQVHGSSYSKVLIALQLSLKISSAGTNLLYAKIYQETLSWFPGFVLILSGLISIVAIIPIRIFNSRLSFGCIHQVIEDEEAGQHDLLLETEEPSDDKTICKQCPSCVQ
ncbi:solute carrier family 46 member 2-like isoform X2 [Vanacampus margaritifer]